MRFLRSVLRQKGVPAYESMLSDLRRKGYTLGGEGRAGEWPRKPEHLGVYSIAAVIVEMKSPLNTPTALIVGKESPLYTLDDFLKNRPPGIVVIDYGTGKLATLWSKS